MSKIAFTINGQPIAGSFYGMLLRKCGSRYNADRVLYKARNADNIVTYISKGLKAGWASQSTIEMDYNKEAMEAWIAENLHKRKVKKKKVEKREPEGIESIIEDCMSKI